ncbi:hypothetical protein EAG_10084 [Camponotus floridanus]|uniref:Uncharacterized protein n=1 Tax=Camponotus floridanus TaxID=104421 RepID=E2AYN7_CAMFO|nr:hypothetical protein EAG_10084 [Camponotus floridanus]
MYTVCQIRISSWSYVKLRQVGVKRCGGTKHRKLDREEDGNAAVSGYLTGIYPVRVVYIGSSSNPAKKSVAEGSNERLLRHLIHLPGLEKCRAIGDAEGGGEGDWVSAISLVVCKTDFRELLDRSKGSFADETDLEVITIGNDDDPFVGLPTNCQSRGSLPSSTICQGTLLGVSEVGDPFSEAREKDPWRLRSRLPLTSLRLPSSHLAGVLQRNVA